MAPNELHERCKSSNNPFKNLSLDEGLLSHKGWYSIKVYDPAKLGKLGIKFYFLCEASLGYVLDSNIYSDASSNLQNTLFTLT